MTEDDDGVALPETSALAAAVLEEEAKRQAAQAERDARVVLPDDLLPGVGDEPMSLKDAMRVGGKATAIVLLLLNLIDELPRTVRVLAPDIQRTLEVSDTVLFGVLGFGGVALVLGSVPMAALADRVRRVAIIPAMSFVWAASTFLSGLVVNPFQLFWTNTVTGFGQAYRIPLSNSLITDTYPIPARSQVFAFEGIGRPIGQLLGPLLVGGVATWVGGEEGWRWAFFVVAVPPVLVGLAALRLREPTRGRFEQDAVLEGEDALSVEELEPSISTAFARLRKIRTFYSIATGIGVVGFALIVVPFQFNLLLDEKYALDALERGVVESLIWLGALITIPIAGRVFDRRFREDPESVVRLMGRLVIGAGVVYAIGLPIKTIGPLVALVAVAQAMLSAAFVGVPTVIAAVSPYRIRTQAFALIPVFVFLMGGFFGGLIGGQISDAYGNRTAMLVLGPAGAIIGGWLIRRGAPHIRGDISLSVEELLEEQAEARRIVEDRDAVPALQVRNLDFSYGAVQVLFDVGFEVGRGETVALLGTNGAGKSTVLWAISGLGIPDRGVVRLNGRTVTYAEAETRYRAGIVQLRGGEGTFPGLTIEDNLRAALLGADVDPDEAWRRIGEVVEMFPALDGRLDEQAENLSGGQQQMLALAMTLVQRPAVLLIDELSLGLAPIVVEELLAVIEDLKSRGQAMVIVEQSLNIALAVADRAVFLEKGQVRFSGPARELAARDDLARAVFLGGERG